MNPGGYMNNKKNALELAAAIPLENMIVHLPVEVMLAFITLHDLEVQGTSAGGFVEVRNKRKDDKTMALKETVLNTLERSKRTGKPQKTGRLRGGLEVGIFYHADGRISLQLARPNVYPSLKEWRTVARYLPGDLGSPRQLYYEGEYYLKGTLEK